MPEGPQVELLRAVLQRGERHRAGREANPRTDRADVMEVVVETLELERDGTQDAQLAVRLQTAPILNGLGERDRVCDEAGSASASRMGESTLGRETLGGTLEPAVLVEQLKIEREDALSDDMKAEVSGLDHTRVHGPNSDLVNALARDSCHPRCRILGVRRERAQRRVSAELKPIKIVGLALVPRRRLDQVDDRLNRTGRRLA